MTTVRAQCPSCGDVALEIDDLTVRVCDDGYTGGVPVPAARAAATRSTRPASERIVDLLVSAGAPARDVAVAGRARGTARRPAAHARRPPRPARHARRRRLVRAASWPWCAARPLSRLLSMGIWVVVVVLGMGAGAVAVSPAGAPTTSSPPSGSSPSSVTRSASRWPEPPPMPKPPAVISTAHRRRIPATDPVRTRRTVSLFPSAVNRERNPNAVARPRRDHRDPRRRAARLRPEQDARDRTPGRPRACGSSNVSSST